MKNLWSALAIMVALMGCFPSNRDDGFRARKPVGALPADSAMMKPDTAKAEPAPDASDYGFSVSLKGAVELHFHDDQSRHTGPATAEEYLPVLEAALKNPSLHEQERQGLERMRDQIKRTGSASDLAVTRRIPNLDYKIKTDLIQALYRGSETLDMVIVAKDYTQVGLEIQLWDRSGIRSAAYNFSIGRGQEAGMDIGAMIEDLTLSLSGGGQGEQESEVQPQRVKRSPRR